MLICSEQRSLYIAESMGVILLLPSFALVGLHQPLEAV